MLREVRGFMVQPEDNKFKKQLSVTLLFIVYVGVLAYLSNFIV